MLIKRNLGKPPCCIPELEIVVDDDIARVQYLNRTEEWLDPKRSSGMPSPQGATTYAKSVWRDDGNGVRQIVGCRKYAVNPTIPTLVAIEKHAEHVFQPAANPAKRLLLL